MDELPTRLLLLINVLIPFVLFTASVYLALHIAFARLISRPDSPVLWFFSVVTGPLIRPVRAVLPTGVPERRVRAMALGVYVALWLVSRVILASLVQTARG
jgi:hypothetical protein